MRGGLSLVRPALLPNSLSKGLKADGPLLAFLCRRQSHTAPTPASTSTSAMTNNVGGRAGGGAGAGGDAGEVGGVEIEHNESGVRVSLEVSSQFARAVLWGICGIATDGYYGS